MFLFVDERVRGEGWEGLLRINTSDSSQGHALFLRPGCRRTLLWPRSCAVNGQHVQAPGPQPAFMVRFFSRRRRERRERNLLRQVRRRCRVSDVKEDGRKDRGEGGGGEEGGGAGGRRERTRTSARFRWERTKSFKTSQVIQHNFHLMVLFLVVANRLKDVLI